MPAKSQALGGQFDSPAVRTERMAKSLHELYRQWVADGRPRRSVASTVKTTTS